MRRHTALGAYLGVVPCGWATGKLLALPLPGPAAFSSDRAGIAV
jgi:hypothetical protein